LPVAPINPEPEQCPPWRYEANISPQRQPGGRRDEIHAATNAIGGRNSHAPNQLLKLTLNPMR
jgi:hypothetical protein